MEGKCGETIRIKGGEDRVGAGGTGWLDIEGVLF